jgi:hypothetical protein
MTGNGLRGHLGGTRSPRAARCRGHRRQQHRRFRSPGWPIGPLRACEQISPSTCQLKRPIRLAKVAHDTEARPAGDDVIHLGAVRMPVRHAHPARTEADIVEGHPFEDGKGRFLRLFRRPARVGHDVRHPLQVELVRVRSRLRAGTGGGRRCVAAGGRLGGVRGSMELGEGDACGHSGGRPEETAPICLPAAVVHVVHGSPLLLSMGLWSPVRPPEGTRYTGGREGHARSAVPRGWEWAGRW